MPVSGRPTKAALLKITQGSSVPDVKGRQKSARGPVTPPATDLSVVESASLRFESTLPKTISDTTRPASNKATAIRQRGGTTSTTTLDRASRAGGFWGCVPDSMGLASTDLVSNVR